MLLMSGEKQLPLSNIELSYFYKEVILFFEKMIKPQSFCFNLSDVQVQAILFFAGIVLDVIPNNSIIDPPIEYKNQPCSFVLIKNSGDDNSILISFLRHLRNSFSHDHFIKLEFDGEPYFCMEDYNRRKQLTMVLQLPYKKFFLLVEAIKQNCK